MFSLLIALATSAAQPAALSAAVQVAAIPAAAPGRTIRDIPGVSVGYYDVEGKDGAAIEKSLTKLLNDPASKDKVRLYSWTVGASINKHTEGTTCTVAGAKSELKGTVHIPRLLNESAVDADVLKTWKPYVSGLEDDAAASLWLAHDRLPALESSLVGVSCDQAQGLWNAGLSKIRDEIVQFDAARAKQRAELAKAAKRAKAPPREKM